MAVAERFHTTPEVVKRWPNPTFLDAIEYMSMTDERQSRYDQDTQDQYGYGN